MSYNEADILLVEDNPNDAELTLRALKSKLVGNKIAHAKDGAVALEMIFGTNDHDGPIAGSSIKVILLDLKLPKVSGLEVLEQIKSDVRTKSIPVVVLTSSREDSDLKKSYELGANSYIVKPVDFESFVSAVVELGLYWILRNQLSPYVSIKA